MLKLLTLILLILIGTLISGCVEKTTRITDSNTSANITDKNLNKTIWYQYTYTGSSDKENAENARSAINPYLIELGWKQGFSIVAWRNIPNLSIVILIPFQLTDQSLYHINQTLENFSFYPVRLNEVVEMGKRKENE